PAKPNEVGSPGRGGARERAQFSPPGGNGVEWTLRRRAAMGKVGRRPQAAKFPLRGTKPLYHRPLIRHGFAVPPSPQGEGFWGGAPLTPRVRALGAATPYGLCCFSRSLDSPHS